MKTTSVPDTYLASVFREDFEVPSSEPREGTRLLGHTAAAVLGSALFGFGLATFSATPEQLLASSIKMPLLLLGTALLCFPTFHLVQVSQSAKPMRIGEALGHLMTALAATGTTWAALSPPVLFLVITSRQYALAKFIAVLVGAAGGVVGLLRFRQLCKEHWSAKPSFSEKAALRMFAVLFSMVGAQLAWVLRPFIGSPFLDFIWFRTLGTTPLGAWWGM